MPFAKSVSLDEFARSLAPHLNILSISQPVPLLRRHNLIVLAEDAHRLREAVLDFEAVESSDNHQGSVVMGAADETQVAPGNEGMGRVVGTRLVMGALLGCLIGAGVAAIVSLIVADVPTAGVAALVGAILGGALGAIWTVFAGLGGSDAYRQSFVNEDISDLNIASLHTDDVSHMAQALAKLPPSNGITVLQVDARGHLADDLHTGERHT